MKTSGLLISCCLLLQLSHAQCLSGNCDNGIGNMPWRNGMYAGELLANTPHGKGTWSYYYQRGLQVDSIVEEGVFFAGVLFKGKQNTIATWYHPNNGGRKDAAPLLYNNQTFYKSVYPDSRDILVDDAKDKSWTGKTDKKGMPTGDGEWRLGDVKLTLTIKEGRIEAVKKIEHYTSNAFNRVYRLTGLGLTDFNFINELTYQVEWNRSKYRDMTLSLVMPLTLACFTLPTEGPAIVTYANGNKYEGFYANHDANGFGVMQQSAAGYIDSGYFRFGQLHGWGQRKHNSTAIDTGFFRGGEFFAGAFTDDGGKSWQSFPRCLSGNCQNGVGKADYTRKMNGSFIYEGQLLQGQPNGSGTLEIRFGANYLTKTGNFAMGELQGYATIEANVGAVKTMRGYFLHDSLTHGIIHYSQSNTQFRSIGLQPGGKGFELAMQPLVWEKIKTPRVFGEGILYTGKGAVVKGEFNSVSSLVNGTYTSADGYQLQFGDRNREHLVAAGMGGQQELNMQFDNLDFVVATYRTRRTEQQAQAAARKAALEAEAQQQKRMDSLMPSTAIGRLPPTKKPAACAMEKVP